MNADLQREFAQHGISWKVADAARAGIHPLAALGVQTHSASPVHVGGQDYGLTKAGQSIADLPMKRMQIESLGADIRLKDAQAAAYKAQADAISKPKALAKMGQVNAGNASMNNNVSSAWSEQIIGSDKNALPGHITKQVEVVASRKNRPDVAAGPPQPFWREVIKNGYLYRYPAENIQDYISEDIIAKGEMYTQKVIDWLMAKSAKEYPKTKPPHGTQWRWDSFRRQWYLKRLKRYKIRK
jgi:hypothetical protein